MSSNGKVLMVGAPGDQRRNEFAPGTGAVWVFTRSSAGWRQVGQKLTGNNRTAANSDFGQSVSISYDGYACVVGGPGHRGGAAWVFDSCNSSSHHQTALLTVADAAGDQFGAQVSISGNGATVIATEPAALAGLPEVWTFTRARTSWQPDGPPIHGGDEVALSRTGAIALVGNLGQVRVYERTKNTWNATRSYTAPNATNVLDSAVALSADGRTAVLTADSLKGPGAVWVFSTS